MKQTIFKVEINECKYKTNINQDLNMLISVYTLINI